MYHPRFTGKHYDFGHRFGRLMKKNNAHIPAIEQMTGEKRKFGGECIAICREVFPEAIEELQGLSDGMDISFDDFAGWIFCIYCYEYQHGCTCFACRDDEHIIFARNSDFFLEIKDVCQSALYKPDNGYRFIGNSTALVQMEDGCNEHGLAIGLTFIFPRIIKPGLNAGILLRYILEKCRTVREALTALRSLPVSSSHTLTMVDKSGDMAVAECTCEKMVVIEPQKGQNFVVSSNYFISPQMQPYERLCWLDARERYRVATQALRTHDGYSPELAKDILSGKYGFMCQYKKEFGFDTLWSTIYDLTSDRILRAEGNPSRVGFKEDNRFKEVQNIRIK